MPLTDEFWDDPAPPPPPPPKPKRQRPPKPKAQKAGVSHQTADGKFMVSDPRYLKPSVAVTALTPEREAERLRQAREQKAMLLADEKLRQLQEALAAGATREP